MTDRLLEPWRLPALFHADEDACSLALRMAGRGSMTAKQFVDNYLAGKGLGLGDVNGTNRLLQRLAVVAGVDMKVLCRNAFPENRTKTGTRPETALLFRDIRLPVGAIKARKRVAPGVLRSDGEDPYLRLSWRLQALPCDPHTGEALVVRCAQCSKSLGWDSPHLWQCGHCGFDLRTAAQCTATMTIALPPGRWPQRWV